MRKAYTKNESGEGNQGHKARKKSVYIFCTIKEFHNTTFLLYSLHYIRKGDKKTMEFIKTGKTKDVYKLEDGNIILKFKDTVTGHASGESDPGGNVVIGSVDGVGSGALKMTVYYFELFKSKNIFSHYVSADLSKKEMVVKPAVAFGNGIEFVIRYFAAGSFVRRFGSYCREGDALPKIFEVTLKDDEKEDPPLTEDILIALNLMTKSQYEEIKNLSVTIGDIIKEDLSKRGMELIDIKFEFGIVEGKIALIDEVSPGNMRVTKDGKKLDYLSLSAAF